MSDTGHNDRSPANVFLIFLRLGLTSFGGPTAHLAYFRDEFVVRRKWLSEHAYADLVALCQFLPGPASSQVGMALGLSRAGRFGALAAWAGFTLPSAVILILFAIGIGADGVAPGALHGLKIVSVAIVAQAVWGMARTLCPDAPRIAGMLIAAGIVLIAPSAWTQLGVIAAAGVAGRFFLKPSANTSHDPLPGVVRKRTGILCLSLFFVLSAVLPILAQTLSTPATAITDAFYRAGSLVFGGGHVVLPLLQAEVVTPGWVDRDTFLAGYGAAQAMPGPLFSFAAFLGASLKTEPTGWLGGMICLSAIFTPSFLLVAGALPFWERLRRHGRARAAMSGVNAAVVGLLAAALYDPVCTGAIRGPTDFLLALAAAGALMFLRLPPWAVVIAGGVAGALPNLIA